MNGQFPPPHPVQFRGSALAQAALRGLGWRYEFDGLPAMQGVMLIYPHTSNWDFPIGLLLKWALGMPVHFWGKDSLFRIPLFGSWLKWVGGVPVNRRAAHGVVDNMVSLIRDKKRSGGYFWLALTPEGTRSYQPGWRSGFYRVALAADVPVGLACLDFGSKRLTFRSFLQLTGDPVQDMRDIALAFEGSRGMHPAQASPIRLDTEKGPS
jgi:1-acyl-sn-glycerol-3-phosphate acyltransferase